MRPQFLKIRRELAGKLYRQGWQWKDISALFNLNAIDRKHKGILVEGLELSYKKARSRFWATWAVRSGKIVRKSCIICRNVKSHGHHSNYDRPFQLVWLCARHHLPRHTVMNKRQNNKRMSVRRRQLVLMLASEGWDTVEISQMLSSRITKQGISYILKSKNH